MEYKADDKQLDAAKFLDLAEKVWPGSYDIVKTAEAISKTVNITAYDGERLVGFLRILTDGYFFRTITELLVLPEYQGRGIGSRLLKLASDSAPTILYFGSQPGVEEFYEKNGCKKSLQSYIMKNKKNRPSKGQILKLTIGGPVFLLIRYCFHTFFIY